MKIEELIPHLRRGARFRRIQGDWKGDWIKEPWRIGMDLEDLMNCEWEVEDLVIPKIKVKSIRFPFSESPSVNTKKEFNSWEAAEAELRVKGPDLGYFKTDFNITFEDGNEYQGRFDIGSDHPTLRGHVRAFCEMASLRKRPAHFKDAHWKNWCEMQSDKAALYCELLDKYDI